MTERRDPTRIVRSWLESGSTSIPDRVLDAALSEAHSTPQRRRWSPWRSPKMQTFVKLGAVAAVLVLGVALGRQFLPPSSAVDGPGATPSGVFGGEVSFTLDGIRSSIDISGRASGLSLVGTATIKTVLGTATLDLECARHEGDTWMFAGKYASTAAGMRQGENGAVLVVDDTPQKVGYLQNSDSDPFGRCTQFVMEMPSITDLRPEALSPVQSGAITLPPAP